MIRTTENFIGILTDDKIEASAEKYGYDNFIPYGLVRDLFAVWTHAVFGKPLTDAVKVESDYDKSFLELISMFKIEPMIEVLGSEFVFDILKKFNSRTNFRALEKARMLGDRFYFEEEEEQFNYSFDLKSISPETLALLEIEDNNNLNTIELSEEIQDILKFYNNLKRLPGFIDKDPVLERKRMDSYTQFLKVNKRRLIFPTFKYDLITKNLSVKILKVEKKDKSNIVLLVDISQSVFKNPKYVPLYRATLLYLHGLFKNEFHKITIYFYNFKIENIYEITSKNQLELLFKRKLVPISNYKGWIIAIAQFKKLLKNQTVIIITDGDRDAGNLDMKSNNIYYIISFFRNDLLKNLAIKTNGKFIQV